ncbi:hypothetical protein D3C87_2100310 [compost metagenome]
MRTHTLTRQISITFDDRINDQSVLFLEMQIVVLRARARSRALKFATRDNA